MEPSLSWRATPTGSHTYINHPMALNHLRVSASLSWVHRKGLCIINASGVSWGGRSCKAAVHLFHLRGTCACGTARAHASTVCHEADPEKCPKILFLCLCVCVCLCAASSSSLHLISPQFLLWTLCSPCPSLYLPFTLLKVSVLSLWATVCTRFCARKNGHASESPGSACARACEHVCLRMSVYLCFLLCVCISSYPLIRMTVFINSLGLMCDSVTPAFLLARLPSSLTTPGPNYRADDLTSDH